MKRFFATLILCLCVSASAIAQITGTPQERYIQTYSSLAVSEMYRSGVPASITLAQGMLESGNGQSELARKSNNHFGIKCHNNWKGKKVYHDDDAKGECFRKYDDPKESFYDHSDFLRYRDRYKFLFDLKTTDYKGWANGLKQAGYATDPAYPKKLIKLIEDYRLYEYDRKPMSYGRHGGKKKEEPVKPESQVQEQTQIQQELLPPPPSELEQVQQLTGKQRNEFHFALSRKMYSQNGVAFVYATEGETYESIAKMYNLFPREILRFNDLTKDQPLHPGTVVYVQKKKNHAARGIKKYVMASDETLRDIAQRYGVRQKAILKKNGVKSVSEIREGDLIKLR